MDNQQEQVLDSSREQKQFASSTTGIFRYYFIIKYSIVKTITITSI